MISTTGAFYERTGSTTRTPKGSLTGDTGPAGPPGNDGAGGPKVIAFFNLSTHLAWISKPPESSELITSGGHLHRWIAGVSGCQELRVSTTCYMSGGGPVLLGVEHSTDQVIWTDAYVEGNYVVLDPSGMFRSRQAGPG